MRIYELPGTSGKPADRVARNAPQTQYDDDAIEGEDREFCAFLESISLSSEELAAFISAPDLSIADVRRLFSARQLPSGRPHPSMPFRSIRRK